MFDLSVYTAKFKAMLLYLKGLFIGDTDFKKYLLRFGLVLLISLPIIYCTQGTQIIKTILYKIALGLIAVGLAELVWAFFFKPIFGKIEALQANEKQAVLIFRGLLYAAIILGVMLGL
jgi:hypothetical protein